MSIEVQNTCPFGSECETVSDGKLRRCKWYIPLKGKNPQGEETIERYDCVMVWNVIVGLEGNQFMRGTTVAVESFRNEVYANNNRYDQIVSIERKGLKPKND